MDYQRRTPRILFCLLFYCLHFSEADHDFLLDFVGFIQGPGPQYHAYSYIAATLEVATRLCNEHDLVLARVRDLDTADQLMQFDTNIYGGFLMDGYKAPSQIYYRYQYGEIAAWPKRAEPLGTDVRYGDSYVRIYLTDTLHAVDAVTTSSSFVCEAPHSDTCPLLDCGSTTNEPFEDWRILASDVDMTYPEAVDYCASNNGELLPIYTSTDMDWALTAGLLDGAYFQPLTYNTTDGNLRWPGGWHLLSGDDPLTPFMFAPGEVLLEENNPAYFWPENAVLVWRKGEGGVQNMATFEDITSSQAKALCKVLGACVDNPCQNDGTCSELADGSYICVCAAGYTGMDCDIDIDYCADMPCANGGTCTDGLETFTCTCAPGYEGIWCLTDIHECASAPCMHGGICHDMVDGYTCHCEQGYEGVNCEIDIDECTAVDGAAPCLHGGACTNTLGGFSCTCQPGFLGNMCQIDIDECSSSPCLNNATCLDKVDGYYCACLPGYIGDTCEQDMEDCVGAPCYNGGSCRDGVAGYTCTCLPGYEGNQCQTDIDDCVNTPCDNGGLCYDGMNTFTCVCATGYSGDTCQIDACADYCLHRGSCDRRDGVPYCVCDEGFSGATCEVTPEPTTPAPTTTTTTTAPPTPAQVQLPLVVGTSIGIIFISFFIFYTVVLVCIYPRLTTAPTWATAALGTRMTSKMDPRLGV